MIIFVIFIFISMAILSFNLYQRIYYPNVKSFHDNYYFYIPTGSTFPNVVNLLVEQEVILNRSSFEWVAEKMNYQNNVKPGRYELKPAMSNRTLIQMLRSGNQKPIYLTINKLRTKSQLAHIVHNRLEADSMVMMTLLNDPVYLRGYKLTPEKAISIVIPNTYEIYWNTDAEQFYERIFKEYENFWTEDRLKKAKDIGLSAQEVIILASIVEEETNKDDEKNEIAGVYLNRLERGWRLQADPTVRFAFGNFKAKRILKAHLEFDSPYNTYLYKGLPPGPICTPSISTLDSTLHASRHGYMYFCAKDDFSGYHYFSETLNKHLAYARRFQRELNRRKIWR